MLLKNIAHLNTRKACPKLGNSDLVQLPHFTGKQREAESRTVTWTAVKMGRDLTSQNSSHPERNRKS